MNSHLSEEWVRSQARITMNAWRQCAGAWFNSSPVYSRRQQREREKAYDRALKEVERETRQARRIGSQRVNDRIVASFARFSAMALDLDDRAVTLLTYDFLPVGTGLARWSKQFDSGLSNADIVQACRNAWTACGLQPLLGAPMGITPAIVGYSLLYPYTDNYLDQLSLSRDQKLRFTHRFRSRLRGEPIAAQTPHEASVWYLVQLIEEQFPRIRYPRIFDALLAIHQAQEESIVQLGASGGLADDEILRISCAKGGTSVLADAYLVRGELDESEIQFAFLWGVLLQLGDDLQDVQEDLERGSDTLFTRAIRRGLTLDNLVAQLLNMSDRVSAEMDALPNGDRTLKSLLRMSWRSLILMAAAQARRYFSPAFLDSLETRSPFRFSFLRARRKKLDGKSGLFARLFPLLLDGGTERTSHIPIPHPLHTLPAKLDFAAQPFFAGANDSAFSTLPPSSIT